MKNMFKVSIIFENGTGITTNLSEEQLVHLVDVSSRFSWRIPRNYGFVLPAESNRYVKINLRRIVAIDAIPIGTLNEEGVFRAKQAS